MKLGIRLHDLGKGRSQEILRKAKDKGFDYIQLVFLKAFEDENNNPIPFSKEAALKVKTQLDEIGLKVAMLGAYFNPVHSNKEKVKNSIEYFKNHLRYAHLLNCEYVGTETGSYNDDKWTYNPKNQTEEGFVDTLSVFKELVEEAQKDKTTILIEPAWGHVIYSTHCLQRIKDELASPYVKFTIDLFNLLYIGNYSSYKEIFEEALQTFKEEIKIVHLKDFYVDNNKLVQCGLGKGLIDFKFIIETIKKYAPEATLIFEGVVKEDIDTSYTLINKLINNSNTNLDI